MKPFKKKKHSDMLQKEGITILSEASKWVVLKNGGIMNGFTRASLLDMFSSTIPNSALPVEIEMPATKSFSILKFNTIAESQIFCNAYDGFSVQLEQSEPRKILYCFFTDDEWKWRGEVSSNNNGEFPSCQSGRKLPLGMEVIEDFINEETEQLLWNLAVEFTSSKDDQNSYSENSETLKHRKVVHFGFCFNYDTNGVYSHDNKKAPEIPCACLDILKPLVDKGRIKEMPDQVTINIYEPGQGIPSHVDTHSIFSETLMSLSLGSPVVMEMKLEGVNETAPIKTPVLLPPRSLAIFEDDSRYGWKHGIASKRFDTFEDSKSGSTENFERSKRVSYTYRKLRIPPFCSCRFLQHCDYQSGGKQQKSDCPIKVPKSSEEAAVLEAQFVQGVYDQIADHFSSTRHSAWPRVKRFLDAIPVGSLVLDLGCGNGKYLFEQASIFKVGLDNSVGLADICSDRGFEVMVSDCLNSPIRSSCADFVISIAVIHHFSHKDRRLKAVSEILRLLKPGGRALIYVWAMEQKHKNVKSHYVSKKNESCLLSEPNSETAEETTKQRSDETCLLESPTEEFISRHVNRTPFAQQDLFVPWQRKGKPEKATANDAPPEKEISIESGGTKSPGETFYRFYHVFREGELEQLCVEASAEIDIVDSYFDDGNWCVVVQKV